MAIDDKTAQHICNVIQRQVNDCRPSLNLSFILHKNNQREEYFTATKEQVADNPCGVDLVNYVTNADNKNILQQNNSELLAIAIRKKSGLLKKDKGLALCFLNYNHFNNEEILRTKALNIAWQAIELYSNFLANNDNIYSLKNNILRPKLKNNARCILNLTADIFSAITQTLQGRINTLEELSKQRMNESLTPEPHFIAEDFPLPICLDALDFIYKQNIEQYKKVKYPMEAAINVAKEIEKTLEEASIEQWISFSLPAQEMAWMRYKPATILGAALYTSENTYVQSIANLFADRLKITPELITTLHDYNPFTNQEVNERTHNKQCKELFSNLCNKINDKTDSSIFLDIAKKQNEVLLKSSAMGWCASALIKASDIIEQSDETIDMQITLDEAKSAFNKEVTSIKWDTLANLSLILFQSRRNNIDDIKNVIKPYDEFLSIYGSLAITSKQ